MLYVVETISARQSVELSERREYHLMGVEFAAGIPIAIRRNTTREWCKLHG